MSDNIYRKNTRTLELFNGRIADAYTKAQTDAKIDPINVKLSDNADYLKSKNMCNPYDSSKLLNATVSSTLNSNSYACTYYCEIKPNTSYTVSRSVFGHRWSIGLTDSISMGTYVYNLVENNDTTTPTVTITNTNHNYLVMFFWIDTDTYTKDTILKSIQIEEGDTATAYAPFRKSNVDIVKDIAELATVSKTGSYTDLSNKPTLGTAAAKNYTTSISSGNGDLPTSGTIYSTNVTRVKQINWYANRYLVRWGNIVTVTGSPNGWVTSSKLAVPVGFRPAYNMSMVPIDNGQDQMMFGFYSNGSFEFMKTGYWQVAAGTSWYTSDAFPS